MYKTLGWVLIGNGRGPCNSKKGCIVHMVVSTLWDSCEVMDAGGIAII